MNIVDSLTTHTFLHPIVTEGTESDLLVDKELEDVVIMSIMVEGALKVTVKNFAYGYIPCHFNLSLKIR